VGEPGQASQHLGHVSDGDALMLRIEKDPQLRNTITAVIVLDDVPDRVAVLERVERMSRSVPGCRHRLVSPPLGLANPRWVVDRDFDLSYHVRWIAAPEPKSLGTVVEYARQSAMSGLDRDRPLWAFTVVEGLDGGRAAVVVKLHHVLTDGMGGIAMLPHLVDVTRAPGDLGPMPPLPDDDLTTQRALALDALAARRQQLKSLLRGTGGLVARSAPGVMRHPMAAAGTAVRNVQALGRTVKPPTERLSPIMVERRGWSRFATLDVDLTALRAAARSRNATVNDAFLAALGNGFARYHEKHGAPVERLRVGVAMNTRRVGDSPYGNHVNGGALVIPVGTDDPAKCMAICHDAVAVLRDDVGQPLANAAGTVMTTLGPFVSGLMGAIMKHCDIGASNVPGVNVPLYLGGAEILAMYGFGPGMGMAANITLLSYRDTAFIGFNVDAAAVPDVDVLVDCVGQGFDAVLALAK
jgi:diacylglycerol O-acyltransferase / wax synthase